jgi:hypothetical protein
MPADQAERWFIRAVLACANSTIELPTPPESGTGAAAFEITWRHVLAMGLHSFRGIRYGELEPLLNEMKHCIKWKPPGGEMIPLQELFPGEDSQIEEVATWFTLRYEVLQLHLGFSLAGVLSTSGTTPETPPA